MAIRRDTRNRITLYRNCGTCGKLFVTTADCPYMRQVPRDGKKQATTYYCSQKCFKKSYSYIGWYDGKAEERRKERERNRDNKEKNRKYYEKNKEKERARARERYWSNPEKARADMAYYKRKRKLLNGKPESCVV